MTFEPMKKISLSILLTLLIWIPFVICVFISDRANATVSSNITKVQFAGDGVSTSFNFGTGGYSVPVYLNTDVQVYIETNSTGAIQLLTLNNQYSIALTQVPYSLTNTVVYYTAVVNLAGGSSSWGALQTGTTLILNRSVPYTNLLNITDYSTTPASTYNQGYDRSTMLSQQLYTLIQQSILQPVSATTPINFPSSNSGLCIGWSGTTLSNVTCGSGTSIPVPIPNSDLATLTQAGLVNVSAITGTLGTGNGGTGTTANANAANGVVILNSSSNLIVPGNIGIGSATPGQLLDIQGTVRALGFTGQNGGGLNGTPITGLSLGTSGSPQIYHALTDGDVQGYATSASSSSITMITDSNSNPSTVVAESYSSGVPGLIYFKVNKGNYWQVQYTNSLSTSKLQFVPTSN